MSVDLVDVLFMRAQSRRQDTVTADAVAGGCHKRISDVRRASSQSDVVEDVDEAGVGLSAHDRQLHRTAHAAAPRRRLMQTCTDSDVRMGFIHVKNTRI